MMQKRLLSLLLITVAVLGIGLILTQRQQPISENAPQSGLLVPDLRAELNAVNAIKITKAKNELVADLVRGEAGWTVASRHNYPADLSKVREYLIKLSESKLRESKTSKAENYVRLGVEDLATDAAKGLGIELGGLKTPLKLIVGISSGGGSPGTFVRRDGEETSYLVSGDVIPDKEPGNWLARDVLDLPSSEVLSVAVMAPDKSVLKIDKTDPAAFNYSVQAVPKGRALSSESAGNATAGALSSVTLEDVLPTTDAAPDPAKTWAASYLSYTGLVIDATLWDSADKTWAKFAARIDDAQLDRWVAAEQVKAVAARSKAEAEAAAKSNSSSASATESTSAATESVAASDAPTPAIPEPFDPAKAKADKRAELEQRVAEINARTSAWAFVIPSWKAVNVKKKLEDLLAPKS